MNWRRNSKALLFVPILNKFAGYGKFYRQYSSYLRVYFGWQISILLLYPLVMHWCAWKYFIFIVNEKHLIKYIEYVSFILLQLPDAIDIEYLGSNNIRIIYLIFALTKFARIQFAYHIHMFNFMWISNINQKHIEQMQTVSY